MCVMCVMAFFFFKQKTAYEMRISDRSSDVCSSDLGAAGGDETNGRRLRARRDVHRHAVVAHVDEPAVDAVGHARAARSEERRVGKERVSTVRSRWSPFHSTQKNTV